MDVNKVFIVGKVTQDPKSFAEGKIVSFSVGTGIKETGKDGQDFWQNAYHNVSVFGALAQTAMGIRKGDRVLVEGMITQRKDKDYETNKKMYHGVKASRIEVLEADRSGVFESDVSIDDVPF